MPTLTTKKTFQPIEAKSHTDPYKIHKYFARRPWNVFEQLIKSYSKEGDIVLDPFCGGGTTIYESIKLKRKAIGFDINPLSIFIVKNMFLNEDIILLHKIFKKIDNFLEKLYEPLNSKLAKKFNTNLDKIEWLELCHQVECPNCKSIVKLIKENQIKGGEYKCNCKKGYKFKSINAKNCGYIYLYFKNKNKFYYFDTTSLNIIENHNNFLKKLIKKNKIKIKKNKIPLNWDRQLEDALYRKNILYFEDFFTKKNLYINHLLKDFINNLKIKKNIIEIFRFILSSSLKDTNIMSFANSKWQSGKPTTWSKHAYWAPPQFCEVNIRSAFENAFNRIIKLINHNKNLKINDKVSENIQNFDKNNLILISKTINKTSLPKKKFIDVIITDPPYGHNVQYLELSHFWFNWNKDLYKNEKIDYQNEAVSNRKKFFKSKSIKEYENNLTKVFKKSFKILKEKGLLILTFNNKHFEFCLALLISIIQSGFVLKKNSIFFQKGVENYKHTSHTKAKGSPYGDFIFIFEKSKKKNNPKKFKNKNVFFSKLDTIIGKNISKTNLSLEEKKISIFKKIIPVLETYNYKNFNIYKYKNINFLKEIYENKAKQYQSSSKQKTT